MYEKKATLEVLHSFEMPRHKGNKLSDEHLKIRKDQELYNSCIERTKFYLTFSIYDNNFGSIYGLQDNGSIVLDYNIDHLDSLVEYDINPTLIFSQDFPLLEIKNDSNPKMTRH
jgi:hypothetical protein